MNLDQRADKLEQEYRSLRRGHGRSHEKWLELRTARKKAIAAKPRRSKSTTDLPLFRG